MRPESPCALVVTSALPAIHADLGAAASALSWTVAVYALGFAAVVLAGVALGDRYGPRDSLTRGLCQVPNADACDGRRGNQPWSVINTPVSA